MRNISIILFFLLIGIGAYLLRPHKKIPINSPNNMKIESPDFNSGDMIPKKFTCDGEKINPPLAISAIPQGTKTLAIVVDDPDAPLGTFTHWLLWNIPANTTTIDAGSVPKGAVQGVNSSGGSQYTPPCPPSGQHRYYFRVYALDTNINLPLSARKGDLEKEISGHILGFGELIGIYER